MDFLGIYEDEEKPVDKGQELLRLVRDARDEWHSAQNYFENVSDPELVDYAVYRIEAARRKYMYLLKLARQEGLENTETIQRFNGPGLS